MEEFLEGLDAEQRAVVMHREGPAIVVAGPGSGKTRTLVARAAALLAEGVTPESIMMITFTRNAAQSMVRRAAALDPRAVYLTAGTFHSVGSRIVQANHRLLGATSEFTVLDEDDAAQIIKGIAEKVKNGAKGWPRATTIVKILSYATNTGCGIEEATRLRAPNYVELVDGLVAVAELYAEHKMARNLLSYDDILVMWTALLEDEEIGPQLRSRYSHVMLDEQQDANRLLQDLVEALVGSGGNLLAVGDASQSIYGFRGSSPNTLRELYDHHPEAKVMTLNSNYRSTVEIVKLSAAIDRMLDTGFQRELVAATGRRGERPTIVDVRDSAAEAEAIADAIEENREAGGDYEDHAILVRATHASRRIEAEFISRRIPFKVQGGTRIDEAAHIRDLLSVARIGDNLQHEPAWVRLLTRFPRIGDAAAAEMAPRLMATQNPAEAADMLEEMSRERRTELAPLAGGIRATLGDDAPADRLERVIAAMSPVWSEVWSDDWKSRARDLEAVMVIAQEHASMADFLTAITLDGSIDRESSHLAEKPDEKPVTISTIHGAKGLEWKKVIVPSLVNGGMPSLFAASEEEREEEKRILFVAATRAKDTLTFYRPRFNGQGNLTSMSEYEPIIAPHVDQVKHAKESVAGDMKIESQRKVDVRSRLMRGAKR